MWSIFITPIHLSQQICTVRLSGDGGLCLFPFWDDAVVLHTHSPCCRDIYRHVWWAKNVPRGLRTSCRLEEAGEDTYPHFGSLSHLFHLSFSVYLSPSPSSSLCALCFIFSASASAIPSSSMGFQGVSRVTPLIVWHKNSVMIPQYSSMIAV